MQPDYPIQETTARLLAGVAQTITQELPRILALRATREVKADGSYVTSGDLLAEELIVGLVRHHLPDAVVVSEESTANQLTRPRAFAVVIDPIDGTENFTSGLPEWGISVSCYHAGRHVASLLGCPEMGAWLSSGTLASPRHQSRIRALSSSLSKLDLELVTSAQEYRILGCCVYNMFQVIRGSFFSFENPKGANAWDILAGLNLALENGLIVHVNNLPYAGEYLTPDRKYRFQVQNR